MPVFNDFSMGKNFFKKNTSGLNPNPNPLHKCLLRCLLTSNLSRNENTLTYTYFLYTDIMFHVGPTVNVRNSERNLQYYYDEEDKRESMWQILLNYVNNHQ